MEVDSTWATAARSVSVIHGRECGIESMIRSLVLE
jgi:hypothetical protein